LGRGLGLEELDLGTLMRSTALPEIVALPADQRTTTRLVSRVATLSLLLLLPTLLSGCIVGQLVGGMIESERRTGSKTVDREYTGLEGKTFAVVVSADRVIQADHPEVVARLSQEIATRLAKHAGASGFVPGASVLQYQYNHPRWVTMTLGQLAKELEVERLVFVDLVEYRLNDPGNAYLWQGAAAGQIGVVEADSSFPDEFAFQKQIRVGFPDQEGLGPGDLPRAAVNTALANRFVDRAAWLFYSHEEKYYPDY